jgi:hypothetical protein
MTLESTPPQYSSVNDQLTYVAYDAHAADPVTYPDYKYVAQVFIGGVKVHQTFTYPLPTTNRGVFSFQRIIREYILAQFAINANTILANELGSGTFSIDVTVNLFESYGGTLSSLLLTDSTRYFFNHYNGRSANFTDLGTYANKPATSRPTAIDIYAGQTHYFIPYFATSTTPYNVVIVSGATTRTKTITPTAANTLQILNIAPTAINSEIGWSGTIADNNYTVAVGGITYNCNIVCEPIYGNYPVHFLSQWGGFETFNFFKASKVMKTLERNTYQQPQTRVSSSGVVSLKTGNIMHQQNTMFGVAFTEKLKINTELLTDAEHAFLFQLVASPLVYLQDGSTFYPVTITATDYDAKVSHVDGLQNLTLEVTFGTKYNTQFQ